MKQLPEHHAGEIWKHGNSWRGITPNGIQVRFPSKSVIENEDGTISVKSLRSRERGSERHEIMPLNFSDGGKTWSGTVQNSEWFRDGMAVDEKPGTSAEKKRRQSGRFILG